MDLMFRRGLHFTLVELLVVIAVIALLASMLLPALGKAKSTSRAIMCSGNMRQWTVGTHVYADSWQDYLPPHIMATPSLTSYTYWNRWDSWLRDVFLPNARQENYLRGKDINGCPEHSEKVYVSSPFTTARIFSYGESYTICNPATVIGFQLCKLNQITNPGRTIQITDMTNDINAPGYRFDSSPERVGYLHLGKANCLFVDGHVAGKRQSELSINDYLP